VEVGEAREILKVSAQHAAKSSNRTTTSEEDEPLWLHLGFFFQGKTASKQV